MWSWWYFVDLAEEKEPSDWLHSYGARQLSTVQTVCAYPVTAPRACVRLSADVSTSVRACMSVCVCVCVCVNILTPRGC